MTKREMFISAIAIIEGREIDVDRTAVLEGLAHEVELIDNRKGKTSPSKTKTQKENDGIKETIISILSRSQEKMSISDLIATDELNGFSNQKISALMRQLVESEKVEKTMEKRRAFFSLAFDPAGLESDND